MNITKPSSSPKQETVEGCLTVLKFRLDTPKWIVDSMFKQHQDRMIRLIRYFDCNQNNGLIKSLLNFQNRVDTLITAKIRPYTFNYNQQTDDSKVEQSSFQGVRY